MVRPYLCTPRWLTGVKKVNISSHYKTWKVMDVDRTNFKKDSETQDFRTHTGKMYVSINNSQLRRDVKTVPNDLVP